MKPHALVLAAAGMMLCGGYALAEHLTPDEALSRLEKSGMHRMSGKAGKLTHTATIGELYVFDSSNGFMILPDDDRAPAVLGYSDSGSLVTEGNPALQGWLEFYNKELQYLRANPSMEVTAPARAARAEIAPLLKTEWNQESPYNMLCPKVNGHDVVTGCVATAMAQFMKYYDYPAKGKGTHSYYWGVGKDTLKLDYDTIPFQWNQMTDTYDAKSTEEAKKAVAELMLACGISVDMHYDIGDSGAATTHMGEALINIFDYSPSLWMAHREYYGYDEWIGMIYDELSQGNPVLYSGQGTAGGHQFICDGFQGDGYFHFNWGWGGLSNGYFLLTALNPDDLGVGGGAGGFNTDQVATLGGRPPQTGDEPTYIVYNSGGFTPDATSVKAGDDLTCGGIYFNYSMNTLPEGSKIGMKFTNATTKAAEFAQGPDVAGMRLDEGRYNDFVKFPELEDGTYYITPALHAGGKWSEIRMPLGTPDRITAVVKDGVATLTSEADASITVKDIEVPATVYAAHDFPIKFTAYNEGDLEYYANITPYMLDSEGTAVASSSFRPMDVLPDASEAVNDYVANFSAMSGQTFGAGDYSLVFRNGAGQNVSTPLTVHVDTTSVATSIKVSEFHLVSKNPIADPDKIEFGFKLTCDSGVYYSCPRVVIFPGDGGYELGSAGGENHYLTAGESADVTVSGDLPSLKDGWYMSAVYSDGRQVSDIVWFEVKHDVSTGLVEAQDDATHEETIYTLEGIRVTRPLEPGIYIIDGATTMVR